MSLIILVGLIGIAASPFTTWYYPPYPMYITDVFHEDLVLSDDYPMFTLVHPFMDKIVIEELTTNGSSVNINLCSTYSWENTSATLYNVTEIRDVYLVCASSVYPSVSYFHITRSSNQSVQLSLRFKFWGTYPSTDYLLGGPSLFLLFAIPLAYYVYKNWGSRPDMRGYAMILIILVSAILIAPLLVYTYNNGGALLRHDQVQEVRTYQFKLNTSTTFIELNESVELVNSETFVRVSNFDTNEALVAVTIVPEGVTGNLAFQTVTNESSSLLQFEFPRENLTGFTIRFERITQDAAINFSIETVRDEWLPWKNPMPYYQSFAIGLMLMVPVLIFPQKSKAQFSDDTANPA